MYSLINVANLQRGQVGYVLLLSIRYEADLFQSLLIHSAAGGIGIACIQLAQYLEAEVSTNSSQCPRSRYLIS